MRSQRSTIPPAAPPQTGLFSGWVRFWFTPVDPVGLSVVRVLAGLLFLSWLLPFAGNVEALFGLQGWFDRQAFADYSTLVKQSQGMMRPLGWSPVYLVANNPSLLTAFFWLGVVAIVLFTAGIATRVTSILTWLVVASFNTNPALDYDGDTLLGLLALYMMVGHVLMGQRASGISFVNRLLGDAPGWLSRMGAGTPSVGANLALRLIQVHFAIVVVTAGLHKLQFGDWWAGVAFWYPLYPPFSIASIKDLKARPENLTQVQFFLGCLSAAAYLTLAWQLAFPLFAWKRRWRLLLVGGAFLGWLGTAFLYRLPLLGPAFVIGSLSFVTAEEWHGLFGLLGLNWLSQQAPVPAAPNVVKVQAESLVPVGHL